MDTLELVSRLRLGGDSKTERPWLEYLVNGQPLLPQLPPSDRISPLGWGDYPAYELMAIRQLLLEEPSELPNGRVPIYVCPECGDLGCGAVTALIQRDGDLLHWSQLGYENNWEEELRIEGYAGVGSFQFRYTDYREALDARRRALAG